jgi:hypothetical protein
VPKKPIRDLLSEARQAAAALRISRTKQAEATTDEENDKANEEADAARSKLHKADAELLERTGQAVDHDGTIISGAPSGMKAHEVPALSPEAEARLKLGGAEATADLSGEEAVAQAEEVGRREAQQRLDEIIAERTGRPASEADAETVRRAIRNEDLDQRGLGELLGSRVIGVGPIDVEDDTIVDEIRDRSHRQLFGGDPNDTSTVTPAERAEWSKTFDAGYADLMFGKGIDELSPVDQMRVRSAAREDAIRGGAARAKEHAADPNGGGGSGTGASPAPGTGTGTGGAAAGRGADDAMQPGVPPDKNPSAPSAPGAVDPTAAPGAPDPGSRAPDPTAPTPDDPATARDPSPSGAGTGSSDAAPDDTPAPASGGTGTRAPAEAGEEHSFTMTVFYGNGEEYYGTADGRWFDANGNEVTSAQHVSTLNREAASLGLDPSGASQGTVVASGDTWEAANGMDPAGTAPAETPPAGTAPASGGGAPESGGTAPAGGGANPDGTGGSETDRTEEEKKSEEEKKAEEEKNENDEQTNGTDGSGDSDDGSGDASGDGGDTTPPEGGEDSAGADVSFTPDEDGQTFWAPGTGPGADLRKAMQPNPVDGGDIDPTDDDAAFGAGAGSHSGPLRDLKETLLGGDTRGEFIRAGGGSLPAGGRPGLHQPGAVDPAEGDDFGSSFEQRDDDPLDGGAAPKLGLPPAEEEEDEANTDAASAEDDTDSSTAYEMTRMPRFLDLFDD